MIEFLAQELDGFAKPLEMNYFPLPKEFDNVVHIGVVGNPQDVVIGYPGFLLCQRIINTTTIYRYFENNRLNLTDNDLFLRLYFLQIISE